MVGIGGLAGKGRGGLQHEIGVDEVVEGLEEDGEETGEGWDDPMGALLVAGPSEPEQTACEGDTTDYHRGKTPFWDGDVVVCREFFVVGGLCEGDV